NARLRAQEAGRMQKAEADRKRFGFDEQLAMSSPGRQVRMLRAELATETDPARRARLAGQLGKMQGAGLGRNVMGMGMLMNVMFGGWEVGKAITSMATEMPGIQRAGGQGVEAAEGYHRIAQGAMG